MKENNKHTYKFEEVPDAIKVKIKDFFGVDHVFTKEELLIMKRLHALGMKSKIDAVTWSWEQLIIHWCKQYFKK